MQPLPLLHASLRFDNLSRCQALSERLPPSRAIIEGQVATTDMLAAARRPQGGPLREPDPSIGIEVVRRAEAAITLQRPELVEGDRRAEFRRLPIVEDRLLIARWLAILENGTEHLPAADGSAALVPVDRFLKIRRDADPLKVEASNNRRRSEISLFGKTMVKPEQTRIPFLGDVGTASR
jgi:hypothetical protein